MHILQSAFCLFLLASFIYSHSADKRIQYNAGVEKVKILSYNIRNARGTDDVTDYDRVAGVINRVAPNCVAVQELDNATDNVCKPAQGGIPYSFGVRRIGN